MLRAKLKEYSASVDLWIEQVLSGDVKVPLTIKHQVQRHVDDLERTDGIYYDSDAGGRVIYFLENLVHTKGAKAGQLFVLEPWQRFLVSCLFGWKRSTGVRRFRYAYIEIPRKNGKSPLAAGLSLYMLTADGEAGAEVYCGATSEKQILEPLFKPAKIMATDSPGFKQAFGVKINSRSIECGNSIFNPVIGDPGDGGNPHFATVDEYHEHKNAALYDTMKTGMGGGRMQPMLLVITTAGVYLEGPCHSLRKACLKIIEGYVQNDDYFVFIATIDNPDDWKDYEQWKIVNLNYGVSVFDDYLFSQYKDALTQSWQQNICLTKHLNVWCNASTAWINFLAWEKCAGDIPDFAGKPVFVAIDLASTQDVAAVVICHKEKNKFYIIPKFFLPKDLIKENPDRFKKYQIWSDAGHVELTPGNVTDYEYIEVYIEKIKGKYKIVELPYDPFQATMLVNRLKKKRIKSVEFRQIPSQMSEPMKFTEVLIRKGRLVHDSNPCMNWMMSNVKAKLDARDNILPDREGETVKIDGPVAMIMAIGRAMHITPRVGVGVKAA